MIRLIFLSIFIFFIFWGRVHRRFKPRYLLSLYFGKKGSGKTTIAAKKAYKALRKGVTVYTNIDELQLPGLRHVNLDLIGDMVPEPDCLCLWDEAGITYDNRAFKTFKPSQRDFYKLQRHYRCEVVLFSQSFDVDKKIRDLTDEMFLVQRFIPGTSIIRPIRRNITLTQPTAEGESRITDSLKFRWIFAWRMLYLPRWVKYFDSYAVPKKPYIPYTVPLEQWKPDRRSAVLKRNSKWKWPKNGTVPYTEPLELYLGVARRKKKKRQNLSDCPPPREDNQIDAPVGGEDHHV